MKDVGGTGLQGELTNSEEGEDFLFKILENQYQLYYHHKKFSPATYTNCF